MTDNFDDKPTKRRIIRDGIHWHRRQTFGPSRSDEIATSIGAQVHGAKLAVVEAARALLADNGDDGLLAAVDALKAAPVETNALVALAGARVVADLAAATGDAKAALDGLHAKAYGREQDSPRRTADDGDDGATAALSALTADAVGYGDGRRAAALLAHLISRDVRGVGEAIGQAEQLGRLNQLLRAVLVLVHMSGGLGEQRLADMRQLAAMWATKEEQSNEKGNENV